MKYFSSGRIVKSGMYPTCVCTHCVVGEIEWLLVSSKKTRLVEWPEWPDMNQARYITSPSGKDIKIEWPFMTDYNTDEEWKIFGLLFKKIVKDMEKDGWKL